MLTLKSSEDSRQTASSTSVDCGRAGRLECDHVIPLDRGGDLWALDNLATRCRRCHVDKTAGENRRELTSSEAAWRELVAELGGAKFP